MPHHGSLVKARTATLTGAATLTIRSHQGQRLDCGGAARTVTLPPEEVADGKRFDFFNASDAFELLTIANDAGTSIVVVSPLYGASVICSGGSWIHVR